MQYYIVVDNLGYMTRIETGMHDKENYNNKVQVPKELFNIAINSFSKYNFINPKVKEDKIQEFLSENTFEWDNVKEKADYYFEEIPCFNEKFRLTQTQEDIKILAEALKTILEPMLLPDGETKRDLNKIQEIIERYTIN